MHEDCSEVSLEVQQRDTVILKRTTMFWCRKQTLLITTHFSTICTLLVCVFKARILPGNTRSVHTSSFLYELGNFRETCVTKSQSHHLKHHMGMIIEAPTCDYGSAQPFFHLVERRTPSEHDNYITDSAPHSGQFSLLSTKEMFFPFKNLFFMETGTTVW